MDQTKNTTSLSKEYRPTAFECPLHDRLVGISMLGTQQERDKAYEALLQETVAGAKERFERLAYANDIRPADLHGMYDLSYALAGKIFSRAKNLSTNIMADVCYDLFNTSCNELVFGELSRVIVPNPIAAVIDMIEIDPVGDWEPILDHVMNAYGDKVIRNPINSPIPASLVHDRLRGIIEDTGMTLRSTSLQNDWADGVRLRIQVRPEVFEIPVPSVKRLISYSFRWRQPIDYFIARDYTRHSELYYRRGHELVHIRSRRYRSLVSIYIRLRPEDQVRMVAELFMAHGCDAYAV